jgi:hypothetical protein
MPGLWKNQEGTREGKYLVKRRDGTVPAWPWFVLGASDPSAVAALVAYADSCERLQRDPEYVADVRALAREFDEWRAANQEGDPDAPRHRTDDPETVAQMPRGGSA